MTDRTLAIEAGAREIDPDAYEPINEARWEGLARLESQAEAQLRAERKAKACIEAAIASGALVPASAVAEIKERCAAIADEAMIGFTSLLEFRVVSDSPSATESATLCAKAAREIADKVRQLDTTSGDYVVGWRDISTAPKDGTWILVAAHNLHPCDAQWSSDEYGNVGWFDSSGFFNTQPTHWMPLPERPAMLTAATKDGERA